MDIDLRLLRSFVQMHEAGSISRAAERMACTQAAMSMRLKMLETEIGAPLFRRIPQGLETTPRGAELYAKALGVLHAYDEMLSQARIGGTVEKLRLGMPDDYALGWLGAVLPGLETAEVDLCCDLSAHLMAGVQKGDLDLALVTLAARPVQAVAMREVALHWVGSTTATPARLAAYPEGCVFRRAMTGALEAAGLGWSLALQSRNHAGIFAAVRAGVAVTAVAAGTAPADLPEHVSAPGLPPLPKVPVYLVAPPQPRRIARKVQDRLIAALQMDRF